MREFKEGDKVKVITAYREGSVGKIENADDLDSMEVKLVGVRGIRFFARHDLELEDK